MDGSQRPAPLDIGCGTLLPLRWSKLCAVYKYDHNGLGAVNAVHDKPFEMNVLVQTTRGRWRFHGKRGLEDVDRSVLVAGVQGDRYGCSHDRWNEDSNLIASLRPNAVDSDAGPLFGNQTLALDASLSLTRAIGAEADDDFDSRVFEIFDRVSVESFRDARQGRRGNLRMQRVKRLIEAHACEDLSLAEIAAYVNLSPFTCLRQFKASIGVTPRAYLNQLRIRRAKELLRDRSLSVAQVALSVGLRDQCYFARWFANQTGVSPSRYRKIVR